MLRAKQIKLKGKSAVEVVHTLDSKHETLVEVGVFFSKTDQTKSLILDKTKATHVLDFLCFVLGQIMLNLASLFEKHQYLYY